VTHCCVCQLQLDNMQGAEGFATALDLGGAGLDTLRAAAGTEAVLDTGLVLALLAQGLPRWFLSRDGASLLLKMVETGIAAELLKQGNLIKVRACVRCKSTPYASARRDRCMLALWSV
jgi:hypothetical protein